MRVGTGSCRGVSAGDEPHVRSGIGRVQCRGAFQLRARHLVELWCKGIGLEPRERVAQRINRIVAPRAGAVPAGIRGLHVEGDEHLLAGVDVERPRLAIGQRHATAVRVERVLGIDERTLVREHPLHALLGCRFLIRGEEGDDVAIRRPAFAAPANEVRDQDGHARLVVLGAAAEEVAVLAAHDEGVVRPVGLVGLDDVEVRREEDRLLARGATAETDDQVLVLRVGADNVDVTGRIAGGEKSRPQLARERSGAAGRRRGVGVHGLGEDVSGEALVRHRQRGAGLGTRDGAGDGGGEKCEDVAHAVDVW